MRFRPSGLSIFRDRVTHRHAKLHGEELLHSGGLSKTILLKEIGVSDTGVGLPKTRETMRGSQSGLIAPQRMRNEMTASSVEHDRSNICLAHRAHLRAEDPQMIHVLAAIGAETGHD